MRGIVTLLTLLLLAPVVFAGEMDRDSSKECAVCHYEWMPEFIFDLKGTNIVDYQSEKVVATEKMCFSCHNGTVVDSRIKIWSGDMHKLADKIPEQMQIPENLPLDDGRISCRTCHTAHATGDPKTEGVEKSVFLRVENADSQLCEACHTDFSQGVHKSHPLKKPKKNYAAIEKKLNILDAKLGSQGRIICQSCHTAHSPKARKLLIYPLNDSQLCSVCHDDKVDAENAVYLKGMLNHPINVKQYDPAKVAQVKRLGGVYGKDNEVICITCHTPHQGMTASLLIKKNGSDDFCTLCHDTKKSIFAGKHDMHNVESFRTKDGKTAQEKGTCESCHDPHGWSLNLPEAGQDMLTKGCLSCHQEGGFAGKKIISTNLCNHPVGREIKAEMNASGLPLFADSAKYLKETITEIAPKRFITCATCHDVHSKNKNSLRVEAEDGRLCITCHADKEMLDKTPHGRNKLKKSCLACHVVHNSQNKRLLKTGANDGCLDCHVKGGSAEKLGVDLTHSHPVNMLAKNKLQEGFKTSPEGLFTCVSCHDPHKPSKTDKMPKDFLRGGYTEIDAFCSACHAKQQEVIGSDHDNRKNSTDSVCGQCHRVHNAQTAANLMAVKYDYKEKDDNCRACHNENGTADKKVIRDGHKIGKVDQGKKYSRYLTENNGAFYIYCSSCHTVHNNGPKRGEEGTLRNSFLVRSLFKDGNFCLGCHEDKKEVAFSKHNPNNFKKQTEKTKALKAAGDTCGVCHAVHNSGYFLFDKSMGRDFEKICTSCHSENGVASETAISTSHKMNVKPKKAEDVFLQNGKIVCSTCHEPHSENKEMLRTMGEENICFACHEDQKAVALSEHNLAETAYLPSEVRKNAWRNVCFSCHKAHNFHKDNRLMWAFNLRRKGLFQKKGKFAFEICTDCHGKNGLGAKKIPEVLTHDKIFKILPLRVKGKIKPYLFDDQGDVSMDGSITCQSCHNPHLWKEGLKTPALGVEGNAADSFLKHDVKERLCSNCHGSEKSKKLFEEYHNRKSREAKNKKQTEAEVLRNLMLIQMNLQKIQEKN